MRPMYGLLKQLLLPPAAPLLLVALGLALMAARRRGGRWLAGVGLLLAWLLASEGVVEPLARWYAGAPAPADTLGAAQSWTGRTDAVVLVLGSGIRDGAAADGGYALRPRTAERLQRGLWWAARLRLPLAFSGGPTGRDAPNAPTEAAVAARTLAELGAPSMLWLEDRALDTRGNAAHSARHLLQRGTRAVVLVTHDLHMPRALQHFRHAAPGVLFIAAPLQQLPGDGGQLADWLPSAEGAARGHYLLYELLGRLAGR